MSFLIFVTTRNHEVGLRHKYCRILQNLNPTSSRTFQNHSGPSKSSDNHFSSQSTFSLTPHQGLKARMVRRAFPKERKYSRLYISSKTWDSRHSQLSLHIMCFVKESDVHVKNLQIGSPEAKNQEAHNPNHFIVFLLLLSPDNTWALSPPYLEL